MNEVGWISILKSNERKERDRSEDDSQRQENILLPNRNKEDNMNALLVRDGRDNKFNATLGRCAEALVNVS